MADMVTALERPLTCRDVIEAFKAALSSRARTQLEKRGLRQRDIKSLVVHAVDRLVVKAYPVQSPNSNHWLCANRCKNTRGLEARHSPYESMVDVAVYAGDRDPYRTLMTAESEASPVHRLGPKSQSGNNDYLWDFWKLLQVPSPVRLFVALVRDRIKHRKARCLLLEKHIERMVGEYAEADLFKRGDKLFSLVLPTGSVKRYASVSCRGWAVRNRSAVPLARAQWG
jgi:hypothetical protein